MLLNISVIILAGLAANHLFEKARLPGLLGVLLVGGAAGPHGLDILGEGFMAVLSEFRLLALAVILLRAGLALSRSAINRVGGPALRMALLPSMLEAAAVALAAPSLLGINQMDGAILGAVMAAVSPAVTAPAMMDLAAKGWGMGKGIPPMILGASALDNAFVILLFNAFMGMGAQEGAGLGSALINAPLAMILGLIAGAAVGYLMCSAFEYFHPRATKMTLATLAASILLLGLEDPLKGIIPISGLLAVMAVGLVLLEKSEIRAKKVSEKLAKLWIFAEILLFTMVGAQVDPTSLMEVGGAGLALILAGLAARSLGVFIALLGTGLEPKERLFCVTAFLPKATVQAAIGAVPLAAGMASGGAILAMAALAIAVTAPLGAIGIRLTGERWLGK